MAKIFQTVVHITQA